MMDEQLKFKDVNIPWINKGGVGQVSMWCKAKDYKKAKIIMYNEYKTFFRLFKNHLLIELKEQREFNDICNEILDKEINKNG